MKTVLVWTGLIWTGKRGFVAQGVGALLWDGVDMKWLCLSRILRIFKAYRRGRLVVTVAGGDCVYLMVSKIMELLFGTRTVPGVVKEKTSVIIGAVFMLAVVYASFLSEQ